MTVGLPLPLRLPRAAAHVVPATDLAGMLVLKQRDLMLLTDARGDIRPGSSGAGLYRGDTRVLSRYELRLNGERLVALRAGGGGYADTLQCTNPDLGPIPRESLGVRRERLVANVLHERVSVRNYTTDEVDCRLSIVLEADDADVFEVRGFEREITGEWLPVLLDGRRVVFRYVGRDGFLRRTHVGLSESFEVAATEPAPVTARLAAMNAASGSAPDARSAAGPAAPTDAGPLGPAAPTDAGSLGLVGPTDARPIGLVGPTDIAGPMLLFDWRLPPGGERRLDVTVWSEEEPYRPASPDGPALEEDRPDPSEVAAFDHPDAPEGAEFDRPDPSELAEFDRPLPALDRAGPTLAEEAWKTNATRFVTDEPFLQRALDHAAQDMRMLVNEGPGAGERYLAAGLPWYATLFGRDAILTAYELLAVDPSMAVDTLQVLARLQSTVDDPQRDAEPGRILHELRTGELARTGEIPHTPYYGTIDATPLWLVLLGETYAWMGDRTLVERCWPGVLAALGWLDAQSALRPDGFLAYLRRSWGGEASRGWGGLPNQGWKDSWDSARMRDGRLAAGSVALSEVQGYVYAARLAAARLAGILGDDELRATQEQAAEDLRARFEQSFWMEDVGAYALGLDGDGRRVDAVSSNAGQVLWSGIAGPEHAARVADALAGPGMWSGWGVRTLSSSTGGYNPIGYHTGSVWPHDNALIAAGLMRYGHAALAGQIAGAQLEAARHFPDDRLPELYCGFGRDEAPLPVPYPVACSPQAWSAGSPFLFVATLLGLTPDASRGRLELRMPYLPQWLPGIRLEGLRVGTARVDLVVRGSASDVSVEVPRRDGDLDVVVRA